MYVHFSSFYFRKAPAAPRLRLPAQSSASARRGGHDEDRIREPTDMAAVHKALFGDRKKPFHGMSAVPYASSGGGAGSSSAVVTETGRKYRPCRDRDHRDQYLIIEFRNKFVCKTFDEESRKVKIDLKFERGES